MSRNYSIENADGVTTIRLQRSLTLDEMFEMMQHVAHTDECNRRLWDVTEKFSFTSEEIKKIADRGRILWPSASRVAFLAVDNLSFGLLRMLEVFREQETYETRVFRDEQAALKWLKESLE